VARYKLWKWNQRLGVFETKTPEETAVFENLVKSGYAVRLPPISRKTPPEPEIEPGVDIPDDWHKLRALAGQLGVYSSSKSKEELAQDILKAQMRGKHG